MRAKPVAPVQVQFRQAFSKPTGLLEDTEANVTFRERGLTRFIPTQKVQIPSMSDEAAVEATVFQTPRPPEVVLTSRLYADGSPSTSTLIAPNVWHNMTIPRRILEPHSFLAH